MAAPVASGIFLGDLSRRPLLDVDSQDTPALLAKDMKKSYLQERASPDVQPPRAPVIEKPAAGAPKYSRMPTNSDYSSNNCDKCCTECSKCCSDCCKSCCTNENCEACCKGIMCGCLIEALCNNNRR